jgi:hypothetical protein
MPAKKPKFAVNDKVAFTDAHGANHTGEVVQVSKKTYFVMLQSDQDGQQYSCHENHIVGLA